MGSEAKARDEAMDRLLARFVEWASARDDIRAAIVIGSRARRDTPHDEFSDLDLPFFCDDPSAYVDGADWLKELGEPVVSFTEPTADRRNTERRALFEPDLDVDFVPLPAAFLRGLDSMDPADAARWIAGEPGLTRGHRVVLDKDGLLSKLDSLPTARPPARPPTGAEYHQVAGDFLYHALWTARKLRRGELWTVKSSLDGHMKRCGLLPMLEWHARARLGPERDTWHDGRFVERWAEPSAARRIPETFARYDEADVERALLASMELFRDLAREVAAACGLRYPAEADARVSRLVAEALSRPRGKVK